MKKVAVGILLMILPISAFAASFPDVAENTVHFGAVEYLKNKGIISGYPNGKFEPDNTINRAEALKIVVNAAGLSSNSEIKLVFSDVRESDWFYEFVKVGAERGIVEGYEDKTFKPANNINLAESLKIIMKAFEVDVGSQPLKDPYPDVEALSWYAPYANYAKQKQLIWPLVDGKLYAGRDISRGEFAQIIYRIMYVKDKSLDVFPISKDWPTFIDGKNGYSIKYPFEWVRINAGSQVIFWKKDDINEQLSWARVYPNSATVVTAIDQNENRISLEQYLSLIEYDKSAHITKMDLNGYPFASISLVSEGTYDYYFQLPNKSFLAIYCQIGDGLNKTQMLEEIRYMVGSVKHSEITENSEVSERESFLSDVRKLILVANAGQQALDLFSDLVIIETDTIGIGTGPIDYHYSREFDVTLKMERTSNTLLAINDAKSTAF
jgi:hypothetical protein